MSLSQQPAHFILKNFYFHRPFLLNRLYPSAEQHTISAFPVITYPLLKRLPGTPQPYRQTAHTQKFIRVSGYHLHIDSPVVRGERIAALHTVFKVSHVSHRLPSQNETVMRLHRRGKALSVYPKLLPSPAVIKGQLLSRGAGQP